jgi:two-component system, OmpR family, sensor histidine kinase SenX3
VNVRAVLMVVLSRLRPTARRKNIALSRKRSGKAALCNVWSDETQLTSMFSNLVENAMKYIPPVGCVEVTRHSDEDEVVISIANTGIGTPEKNLARTFERFSTGRQSPLQGDRRDRPQP